MVHRSFVWLHRWTGLLMSVFLIVVALTGTLLAFRAKLDRLLNPQLYTDGKPGQPPLDLAALAERAEALAPQARPGFFSIEPGQSAIALRPRKNPATGQPYQLAFGHLILDPYTGRELGRCCDNDARHWRMRVMPFIYNLHANLAMGPTGEWILGIVALVWTLDCFVGFYLTLPRGSGGFVERWKYAWQVKWRASTFRVNFDLHRAGGLWFWLLLLVFAWSSVMLALRPVYGRVTGAMFDYETDESLVASAPQQPNEHPRLGWREAQAAGERLMAEQAAQHGFTITRPYGLAYIPEFGVYAYDVRCSRDIRGHGWDTGVWIDGNTGTLRHVFLPSGQHAGNTISTWLWGLHYGDIRDFLPYRILVSFFGLVIVMLSATGAYIWWKKRRVRKMSERPRNLKADHLETRVSDKRKRVV
jgi:uncharacterized iron-regulated membrane protein